MIKSLSLGSDSLRENLRIVFISSESGYHIPAGSIHYGMTKAAQIAVARGLAEATAETGITVNSVLPGPTRTAAADGFLRAQEEAGADVREVERQASATTGAALRVDGGTI